MPDNMGRQFRIFLPFALGYFLSYLYRVINAVLAPNLVADIGVVPSELGLLTAAYFISFAAFQLPLGVLLDRFGPRKIESALLVVAAAGALVFAHSDSLMGLVVGRSLIGLGVSACLMAAFKAYVLWFPRQQLPMINGFQMASGGLGALAATAPVELALGVTDWRGVFVLLAVATLLVAGIIFLVIPEPDSDHGQDSIRDQIAGMGHVMKSPAFWRVAPWATLSQASFLSIHGLWAGPWLRDVAGLDRDAVAQTLMLVAGAMVAGYIVFGMAAERLSRNGWPPMTVAASGMGLFMVQLGAILWPPAGWERVIWVMFGFFGTSGIVCYAVLSQAFAAHLAGRVNTLLNLLVFVVAFCGQWGIGGIIGMWPETAQGGYAPEGYRAAFAVLIALQLGAAIWFGYMGKRFRNATH